MPAESVRIFGLGKEKIHRSFFKQKMHFLLKNENLYPQLHQLRKIVKIPTATKLVTFEKPVDLQNYMFNHKICPHFLIAVLKTVKSAQPLLDAENKRIAWFDLGRLQTLSNKVYNTKVDRDEKTRWQVFNDTYGNLYNKDLAPMDRINVLIAQGILGIEDKPKSEQQQSLPSDKQIGSSKKPRKKTVPKPHDPLIRALDQQTLWGIKGFKPEIKK